MLKKSRLALPLAALLAVLSGCTTVQGVVRDKPTGNPIPSANVTIKDKSGTTDAMGAYKVSGSFEPSDTMMINAPGYHIYTKSLGEKVIHDIELTPR